MHREGVGPVAEGHAEGHARHQPLASLRMSLGDFCMRVLSFIY